jgi:hypothetical protein
MGHIRLARLPATKHWEQVVGLLRAGGSIGQLAAETAHAAENELQSAKGDPALAYSVWLLTQLPLAARSQQFRERLVELGFDANAGQSVLTLVAGLSLAIDRNIAGKSDRTDLGELARQAAAESLSSAVGPSTQSLFGASADDVRRELGRLATKDRFARLASDFFARLTQKTLEYYLSRELPNHIGPDKTLETIDRQIGFRVALERHCREAALIVEEFAGGWYSKGNFQGTLNPVTAQGFTDYALKKMRDELRKRRSANG